VSKLKEESMATYNSESGDITMVLTGESLITRGTSMFTEENYLKMVEIMRAGDVTFTNAEMIFHDYESPNNPHQLGTYMRSSPQNIKELQWMGVNLVACSNNHAYDFGEGGILKNIENLDKFGLAHAGSGKNLADAREPGYIDTDAGRVALISLTDSGPAEGRAGEQRRDMQGRPGVSWLRSTAIYYVDQESLDALKKISQGLGFEDQKKAREFTEDSSTEFHLFGQPMYSPVPTLKFVLSKDGKFGQTRIPNEYDMEQILDRVSDAKRMADWVIVTMHNHQGGATITDPGDHLVTFAKAALDAGADVYTGHGPHRDRGIELYKGKPIFYSLGDFFMQNDTVLRTPQDRYLMEGLGWDAVPADFYDTRSGTKYSEDHVNNDTKGMPADFRQWESTMAQVKFKGKKLSEITLLPLDLGFRRSRGTRGRPTLATGEVAKSVLDNMQQMSSKYGTKISIKGETGSVDVS